MRYKNLANKTKEIFGQQLIPPVATCEDSDVHEDFKSTTVQEEKKVKSVCDLQLKKKN